jgi:hypothetical protein
MNRLCSSDRKRHRDLFKLFSAVADRIEQYDDPPNDTGYWYGERAMTGFLSAAAWSMRGGWSVEEFTGLRMNEGRRGSGRGDIWLGFGKNAFTIEAKAVWPGSSVQNAINGAETKLSEAKRQLRRLHKMYRVGLPVAVCYVIPDLNVKGKFAGARSINDFFTELPRRLTDRQTAVASFWYSRKPPLHKGRIYPGVIVVARILSIWRKRH